MMVSAYVMEFVYKFNWNDGYYFVLVTIGFIRISNMFNLRVRYQGYPLHATWVRSK